MYLPIIRKTIIISFLWPAITLKHLDLQFNFINHFLTCRILKHGEVRYSSRWILNEHILIHIYIYIHVYPQHCLSMFIVLDSSMYFNCAPVTFFHVLGLPTLLGKNLSCPLHSLKLSTFYRRSCFQLLMSGHFLCFHATIETGWNTNLTTALHEESMCSYESDF